MATLASIQLLIDKVEAVQDTQAVLLRQLHSEVTAFELQDEAQLAAIVRDTEVI